MRRRHNPHRPPWHVSRPVVLDEDYQREVDRCTEKLERQYARAQKRVEQAERHLKAAHTAKKRRPNKQTLAALQAVVDARRAELEDYRRMMESTAAPAQNRGQNSFRPVPITHQKSQS